MSASTYDWSVAGFAGNPIPGDPELVVSTGRSWTETGRSLSGAQAMLRRIDSSDLISETTAKVGSRVAELESRLILAADRYSVAGPALTTYGAAMERAQQQAVAALQAAAQARAQYQTAQAHRDDFSWQARSSTEPAEREQLLAAFARAQAAADDASAAWHAARSRILDAQAQRDTAAGTASRQIHMAVDGSDLNDSFADKVHVLLEDIAEFVEDLLDTFPVIRAIVDGLKAAAAWVWDNLDGLSLLFTALAVVTIWCPPLSGFFAVVSRVLWLASLAKQLLGVGAAVITATQTHEWGPAVEAIVVFGLTLAISKKVGAVSDRGFDAIGKKAVRDLARRSQSATGSLRAANDALRALPAKPSLLERAFPGIHLGANYTRAEAIIRTLGPGGLSAAEDPRPLLRITENHFVRELTGEPVKQMLEPVVDATGEVVGQVGGPVVGQVVDAVITSLQHPQGLPGDLAPSTCPNEGSWRWRVSGSPTPVPQGGGGGW